MTPSLRSACLLALALASGSAHALGLGQIVVRSAPGQPLVAEIPVISNDPTELVDLEASLASPETFTRIGLEPPVGVVADLQFQTATDASGRTVIRVTSSQPVTQQMLTFLVQVDWGQGRLVREYSAVVDSPRSIAETPAPPVQAPVVAAPQVIERPVAPPVAQVPAPVLPAQRPAPAPTAVPTPRPAPQQPPAPVAAVPKPAQQPAPAPPTNEYRVRAGDTASKIAATVAPAGVTAEQTMIGLLRANPAAFAGGDLNQLRRGSILRVPASAELESVEARAAAELVRTYARQWRQARTQPEAPVAQAAAPAAPVKAPAPAAGRLEIVPPGAGRAAHGGTQSGIASGGEGDMLRQQLVETKETLAARDAEVQELKSRVAELEKLQADQQKLIAMRDTQMNAAQQRGEAAKPAPAQAPAPEAQHSSMLPWLGGIALILVVLAGAWARRRRAEPTFRAPATTRPSIADAFAAEPTPAAVAPPVAAVVPEPAPVEKVPSWQRAGAPAKPVAAAPVSRGTPVWTPGDPPSTTGTETAMHEPADASHIERLELAQAYLDLGDTSNARRLLGEVVDSGDATARGVASRMLQDLG